jgi:hypothetical protein
MQLKPEGGARFAHAVNKRERTHPACGPRASLPALSAQLFREIAGSMYRQLIRQSRVRSQAMFDLVKVRAPGADQLDLHLSRREQVLNCANGSSVEPLGVAYIFGNSLQGA